MRFKAVSIRRIIIATVTACTLLLGGCLSDEVSTIANIPNDDSPVGNNPPSISGSPQTAVMMGDSYSFTPTASDPDGDTLTFSVQNLPPWTSFDQSDGSITGQPSLANIGVFDQIVVSVSDGNTSVSLGDFSIEVSQVALGSMTLSWDAPTTNTDGTALTDLSGYRLYYGTSQGVYPNRVDIDTTGLTTYVVDNLIPSTYYVVATSVNTSGVESTYSNAVVKTVQ